MGGQSYFFPPAVAALPVRAPAVSGYAQWVEEVFTPAEKQDPARVAPDFADADGAPNLTKYALGLDPHRVARVEVTGLDFSSHPER